MKCAADKKVVGKMISSQIRKIEKEYKEKTKSLAKEMNEFSYECYMAAFSMVLLDKFAFTTDQAINAMTHVMKLADSMAKDYITFNDVFDTLSDEYGMTFDFYKEMNGNGDQPTEEGNNQSVDSKV